MDARHLVPNHRSQGMRYERLFALGSGGMASVHLALAVGQSGFNRLVVVKSMHQELLVREETHQMFLAEARLSARLNHPNVVQVSEVVEASDGIMLVMEYLDGLPLSSVYTTAGDAFTLPMRIRLICEVLAGLHYAHELTDYQGAPLGIVHRDVSPQNVFATYDGRVKLLDFGIAKATASADQTRSGMIKGRLAYMPAEQFTGSPVDRRTDIYAVGCLLWEALAKSRMWANQSDREIARSVISGKIPTLSSRAEIDPELERIVTKATSPEPDDRYATAEAMRIELEQHLSTTLPVTGRDIGDLLSRLCHESRKRRQRAIADAISKLDLSSSSTMAGSVLELPMSGQWARGTGSRHGSGSLPKVQLVTSLPSDAQRIELSVSDAPPSGRQGTPATQVRIEPSVRFRSRAWLPLAFLPALAAAFVYWSWLKPKPASVVENVPSAAAPSISPRPAEALMEIHKLTIEVTPREARVWVNGQRIEARPAVLNLPRASEHVVRVELEGYQPNERSIRLDENMSMTIVLAATPSPPKPQTDPSARPRSSTPAKRRAPRAIPEAAQVAAPAASPAASPPPQRDCDPPYYFSAGIKTYKPGCI